MASFVPGTVPSAYRQGDVLFVPRGAGLPANCVKCGSVAQKPWRKNFAWHNPWLALMIVFPGLVIYAIVALIVQKKMELNVLLCDLHHSKRRQRMTIGIALLLACIPVSILVGKAIPGDAAGPIAIFFGFFSFVASLLTILSASNYIRPKRIDDQHGEFTGVSESFLQLLPFL